MVHEKIISIFKIYTLYIHYTGISYPWFSGMTAVERVSHGLNQITYKKSMGGEIQKNRLIHDLLDGISPFS